MARILIAEDEAGVRLLVARALRMEGHEVVMAEDGDMAIDILAEENGRFDLILSDIRMPGLDGLEVARRIRAREAETGAEPLHLVALTANTGREDVTAAFAAGFDNFLPKPLNLRALPGLLNRRAEAA